MPKILLQSLLSHTETGKDLALLNLTPYDAHLESALLLWGRTDPSREWRSLSLSCDSVVVDYSAGQCGLLLFEDCLVENNNTFGTRLVTRSGRLSGLTS